jgi:hypothetical protein
MKRKSIAVILVVAALLFASSCLAQTPAPPAPTGWTFSTAAGYSNVTNAPTNNGFANVTELKLSTSLAIRGDVFIMTNPNVIGSYVGPEYIFPANRIFKSNPNNPVNSDNVEFFFNAKAGDLRSTDPTNTTKAKFSWGIGGGFNIKLSDKTFIRPLDVSYIRGSVFQNGGTVIGNHLQAAAFLGVRF